MRFVTLVAVKDEYDTDFGFKVKGTDHTFDGFMACRNGVLVAHDILEHVNGVHHIGSVWDELEAVGAIWFVRGRHGDFLFPDRRVGSMVSPHANVAAEVTRMFGGDGWDYTGDRPGQRPDGLLRTKVCEADDDFREILAICRKDIPREHEAGGPGALEELERYLTVALHRLRLGYRKAQRRFRSDWAGGTMFVNIRDAVGECAKHIEYEGQEFRLAYERNSARCWPLYQDDY